MAIVVRRAEWLCLLALLAGCAPALPGTPNTAAPGAGVDPYTPPRLAAPAPIGPEEYQARRAALAARMDDGLLLVLGESVPAADYLPFAQRPNFRYLTGITEPGALLAIEKRGGAVTERLWVLPRDPSREIWEGERLGMERAAALSGIPASDASAVLAALDSLIARAPRLYLTTAAPPAEPSLASLTPEQQLAQRLLARRPGLPVESLGDAVRRLRAAKSPAELDRLRRAVYITVLAQRAAMRTVEPGFNEFEIQGLIEYTFRRHGAKHPGFSSIVGSGPNSTTLHYRDADRWMRAGETLVMDVGASFDGYTADVTRTVPVSGRFTPEQRAIYEIVLAAQKAAESVVRPGASWAELTLAAESTVAAGLARLGLIEGPDATYQCTPDPGDRCPQFRLFYLHGLGHGIGLDVHDPDLSSYGPFREGSIFTIEPGVYVRADRFDHLPDSPANRALAARLRPVVDRYRNIGVRIEDDYLITRNGTERLSEGAPREIAEIEALMALPGVATAERRREVAEWYPSPRDR